MVEFKKQGLRIRVGKRVKIRYELGLSTKIIEQGFESDWQRK